MQQTPKRAGLILGTALAMTFAGAATAQTGATTLLTGFGDFSGGETRFIFDDLGLVNGEDVASVGGVDFELTAGSPAKFFEDAFPRESGPAGAGSVDNFWGFASPYPDLDIFFPSPIHRVAFELRVNDADDVAVTLVSNGEPVEKLVVPSRGSDAFYFYGYENVDGFDEVRVDVVDNASGAFSLDNLTFESLGTEEPPDGSDELPRLACNGFETIPPSRHGKHHHAPFRALLAQLTDAEGSVVTPADLSELPAVRVVFTPDGSDESVDVTDDVVWAQANRFAPTRRESWIVWLLSWRMREPGLYMAMMESGDPSAYTIDPACADWTWNERPKPRHHWRGRRHHRSRR
jgi:hypothetical protein